jgi:hypothetical protein
MLRKCVHPGCETLTLGSLCIHHEPPVEPRTFPRGRPYRLKDRDVTIVPAPMFMEGNLAAHAVSFESGSSV